MDNQGNMTITSANSTFFLTVPGLYDTPQRIEGFATDAAVSVAQTKPVVTEMGIDGHLSVGWVPTAKEITVTLAADSPSRALLEDWATYQETAREVYVCSAEFVLPGINRKFTGTRGVMTTSQPGANAAQTLQSSAFVLTFERWAPSDL